VQSGVPFQTLHEVWDHNQMGQAGIGACRPGFPAHFHDLAAGEGSVLIQYSHCGPFEDMGCPLTSHLNRTEDTREIRACPGCLGTGLDDIEDDAKPTGITRTYDMEVDTCKPTVR
jgi:hypothetical protein